MYFDDSGTPTSLSLGFIFPAWTIRISYQFEGNSLTLCYSGVIFMRWGFPEIYLGVVQFLLDSDNVFPDS